jgi:hypothetical protein
MALQAPLVWDLDATQHEFPPATKAMRVKPMTNPKFFCHLAISPPYSRDP